MGFGKTGNSPYKSHNRGGFLGHAQGVFIPRDCLAAKPPHLMHIKNVRSTSNHHANDKTTESQLFISNRFFENQPNEICSRLSKKASKARFFKPEKFQNHSNEGKGKERKEERGDGKEVKRKNNGCTLSFHNSYFGNSFWPKKNI